MFLVCRLTERQIIGDDSKEVTLADGRGIKTSLNIVKEIQGEDVDPLNGGIDLRTCGPSARNQEAS